VEDLEGVALIAELPDHRVKEPAGRRAAADGNT
jgi:hypothetical protein